MRDFPHFIHKDKCGSFVVELLNQNYDDNPGSVQNRLT